MKKLFDVRAFLIAVFIAGLLALIATEWLGAKFWLTFVLIALAMFINGWVAYFEDKRPGGFENPAAEKKESSQE